VSVVQEAAAQVPADEPGAAGDADVHFSLLDLFEYCLVYISLHSLSI
jgi:hypothetical protein